MRLQTEAERVSSRHLEILGRRMKRAEELQRTDPQAAAAIWRGIVELYSDKPWAAEIVARAREELQHAGTNAN